MLHATKNPQFSPFSTKNHQNFSKSGKNLPIFANIGSLYVNFGSFLAICQNRSPIKHCFLGSAPPNPGKKVAAPPPTRASHYFQLHATCKGPPATCSHRDFSGTYHTTPLRVSDRVHMGRFSPCNLKLFVIFTRFY